MTLKAPPAPPNASEMKRGAPLPTSSPAVAAQPKTLKEELVDIAKDVKRNAAAVPTPNVTDSQLHGRQLSNIALKLEQLAAGK